MKTAIITGCNRGLGKALMEEFGFEPTLFRLLGEKLS